MAYETGSSTTITDLLDKLRIFAVANGWTLNFQGARTSGTGQAVQLTKGAMACTWIADTAAGSAIDPANKLGAYQHNTYSAGNGTENQAGKSAVTFANDMAGPFIAYHFMTGTERGSDYLYVVVETTSGVFKHVGVGKLITMGAITNGHFNFAVRWNYTTTSSVVSTFLSNYHAIGFDGGDNAFRNGPATQIRADSDAISPRWYDTNYGAAAGTRLGGGFRVSDPKASVWGLVRHGISRLTGRTLLTPCMMHGERAANSSSPLGFPPHLRWVRIDDLDPGAILTLGTDQWKVFPIIRKNGGTGQPNSGGYGYAYKVN